MRTLLVLGLGIGMLAAQETPSANVQVTLARAVREAIDKNLGLLAERYNVSIAEARMITAKLRPNPVLTVDSDYIDFLGKFNRDNAAGPTELSARADFVLERTNRLNQRQACAGRLDGAFLFGLRVAEVGEHAVTHVADDIPFVTANNIRDAGVIGDEYLAEVLGIETSR